MNPTNDCPSDDRVEFLAVVAGLMDALHSIVDMNMLAMGRFYSLAKHTGFETPESPEFASLQGHRVHEMLAEWEARVTGQEYVPPPTSGRTPPRESLIKSNL